ncbi:helix-turn-helix domain-containing protein [Thioflexithrix psekupsensis]|uniref:Transcriptional regulator n=1 Tax=Thioflexithrix psekupsensis TaxID=1570016 RepID=A0A251X3A5_9GAMM|nr:transcriptional regulator [Thioflexithrix psekupsensis]OUD11983.1 transcriptional regulator [Thioflexithrix psekupsensis]
MNHALILTIEQWENLNPVFSPPHTEDEYQQKIVWLEELLMIVGDDEQHPLSKLVDTLATLIESYENKHHPVPDATPAELLNFLMSAHDIKQSDLPEIGSQGVVSEILNGKRQLNLRQIKALSERFGLPVDAFI